MTPERWSEIERLYHSAREHGPGVLAETDPELRREVERLLAVDTSSGCILDRPGSEKLLQSETAAMPAGMEPAWVGRTVSHYRILESLGAGGMGVVYKALDSKLGRLVALKFLPPHLRHDSELKQRLKEEARAASALDHPNIVVVHDIDETPEGDLFIAMALHEGSTLKERIRTGLSPAEALRIARQIASGLARAHDNAIFHRDIKPANIIVADDGVARIIDFGLAKSLDATITAEGSAKGTPLYMSPEQAAGKTADYRTDLWSLGALLYEMLAGKPPYPGGSQLQVMHAIVHDPPPRLRDARPDLPAEIDAIVQHALQKDVARRYQSAAELARDLSAALTALERPATPAPPSLARYRVTAAALIVLAAIAIYWFYRRSVQRQWAREQAPHIAELATAQPVSAFRLWKQAGQILPGDPQLAKLAQTFTVSGRVASTPSGAKVEIQDYTAPGEEWLTLGITPLPNLLRPKGHFRWRFTLPGAEPFLVAPATGKADFHLPGPDEPAGMVWVPGGESAEFIDFVGWVDEKLPAFDIDKFEVTNAEYQKFVDEGGYRKPEFWREKFVKEGTTLTLDQAMELFRDSTGRPGPATWAGGHFPAGRGNFPVSGVSWYEAAAYAAFAGKSLPVVTQWYKAAPGDLAPDSISQSNFGGQGPVAVGSTGGVGPYGTYDMAGNVKEWCVNLIDDRRFILGGAWRTPTYTAYDPDAEPPFDRSEMNGIRCVRNRGPLPEHASAPVIRNLRDFSNAKPVSDEVFKAYQVLYDYDHAIPVAPQDETVVATTADWTQVKLTIDAIHGEERLPVNLFLPRNVHPPFQAVVFYPSARVNGLPNSSPLGDMQFIDYVIQSGRALIYPIYTGTYDRGRRYWDTSMGNLQRIVKNSKEVQRSVDYLQSRPDIDKSKIVYLGVSQGTAEGVIYATLEERFKAVVFLDGGFFLSVNPLGARDPVNFAPRLKKPVLMVNGRYDFAFSASRSQDPMFRMLGAPDGDKSHVSFDTPHDVSQKKAELSREVLAWLDRYLGRPE